MDADVSGHGSLPFVKQDACVRLVDDVMITY